RGSSAWRTCPRRSSRGAAATTDAACARCAPAALTGCAPTCGACTTWGIRYPVGPANFTCATPSITAPAATCTSTPTWGTWPCPRAITPTAWCIPRCVWSWRTACRIARPLGICGATIASLCPSPRFRTGLRRGEKRAAADIPGEYLDAALRDFSGYIAADELYDGPFCILSIVDNRTFKRLSYHVLDRDPTQVDIAAFFRR